MAIEEIKTLIEDQGKAWEALKTELAGVKSKIDGYDKSKMDKIEADLDKAVEAKASLEQKIQAQEKATADALADLELRLKRAGDSKSGEALDREIKTFNLMTGKSALTEDGYREYKSAFMRALRVSDKQLTPDEMKALSVGTDSDGGYLVTPDTSGRIVTKVFETSVMRPICNVQPIGTDKLEGIEDLNETAAGWVGETAARGDTDTPSLGQYSIEAFEMYAQPKATQKMLDDASLDVEAWLSDKVADRLVRLENAAFVSGNGAGKPKGFTAYETASDTGTGVDWGKIGFTKTGANGAFKAADAGPADCLFDLVGLVKDAYLPASRFVTRRSIITAIRKLKDEQGQFLWQPSLIAGEPERLMGYPITRAEDMPALATGSQSLYFGDFGTAYTIVDRQGIRVLRDPFTAKPYVRFYTTKRTGGGVVNFEAIKALKFAA